MLRPNGKTTNFNESSEYHCLLEPPDLDVRLADAVAHTAPHARQVKPAAAQIATDLALDHEAPLLRWNFLGGGPTNADCALLSSIVADRSKDRKIPR